MSDETRRRHRPASSTHRADRTGRTAARPIARAERWTIALLVLTTAGSVLAVGAVHVPVLLMLAVAAFVAVALAIGAQETFRPPAPAVFLMALAGYTLLQSLPLPIAVIRTLSPNAAEAWERALIPLGERSLGWATLSLDPGASSVEALKLATYAALFVVASVIARKRGAVVGVLVVYATAVLAALVTLVHGLLGFTKVFGLYQPRFSVTAWHVGPLLNPNNLAGYLNLGILCGLGLIATDNKIVPAWLLGVGLVLLGAVDVTSASRGGVLSLAVGVVMFALLTQFSKREEGARDSRPKIAAVIVVAGVFAFLGGNRTIWTELWDRNADKLEMAAQVAPMSAAFPWFGVGRGAFESAFAAYRAATGNVVFTHAENFPAQWVAEWGVPLGVVVLGALGWLLRPVRLGVTRSRLMAGAWIGVVILLLQNLVDLGLEVAGVAIGMAVILGSLWGDHKRRGARDHTLRSVSAPLAAAVATALGLVVTVLAGARGWNDVGVDREAMYAASQLASASVAEGAPFRSELRAAMLRHPADPYFPLLGGQIAWARAEGNPMPWIQRSFERGMINGGAHLLTARVLAARRAIPQAMLELRLAAQDDGALVGYAAPLAVQWGSSVEQLKQSVPTGQAGLPMLETIVTVLPSTRDNERRVLSREVLVRDSARVLPHLVLAESLLAELERSRPEKECIGEPARIACAAQVDEHARALENSEPSRSRADQLRARVLIAEGKTEAAEALLATRCKLVTDVVDCLYARAKAAARSSAATLPAILKQLISARCDDSASCADVSAWSGNLLAARQDWGGALNYFLRAAKEAPTESNWLSVEQAASHVGGHALAIQALEHVKALRGQLEQDAQERLDAHRTALLGAEPGP